ncbi:transposase [Streptomyces lydicus]|uniref:transposase n=1 Tax=Streptomyces lydicus TaxID=47763 RepID=UPI0037AF7371
MSGGTLAGAADNDGRRGQGQDEVTRGCLSRTPAGRWQPGEWDIVIVTDSGCDVTRLAWVLRDLPVELIGRNRGDRVMRLPKPLQVSTARAVGRPSMVRSSASPSRRPGPDRRSRSSRRRRTTARLSRRDGAGSTSAAAPPGCMARPRRRTLPDRRGRSPLGELRLSGRSADQDPRATDVRATVLVGVEGCLLGMPPAARPTVSPTPRLRGSGDKAAGQSAWVSSSRHFDNPPSPLLVSGWC